MKYALVCAALLAAAPVLAQSLSVEDVVTLSTTGIGDEAIIAKVKSSGQKFDLSTGQMVDLKKRGVSGPVLAAMLANGAGAAAPSMSMDSADPMVPHPSGVYLLADGAQPSMRRIDATVTNQAKTGGIFGYALTGGIASMSVKAAIQNETARVQTPTAQPTFYFFFDESNPDMARMSSSWTAGNSSTVSSPSEFTLIKLMKKDGRREARVGSMNIAGAKTGVMDKDRIAFDYQMVRPGVFKASPSQALTPGEYGFIYSIAGGGAGGAMTARIFDFTVL